MPAALRVPVDESVVVDACRHLAGDVDRLSLSVARLIVRKERYYSETVGVDGLLPSVRTNLLSILDALSGRGPTSDAPRHTGHLRAEQGVPLAVVERAYRLGMSCVWEELVHLLGSDPDSVHELLRSASSIWSTLDRYLEVLAAAYREVEIDQLQRDDRLRDVALAALFQGSQVAGMTVLGVSAALRLPTTASFVVIATDPIPEGGEHATAAMERALDRDGVRSVWRADSDGQIGLAALPRHYPVDRLAAFLTSCRVGRAGLSDVFTTLADAPSAVADARSARATATPGSQDVARYGDVRVAVLVVSAPSQAVEISEDVLQGVLRMPVDEQDRLMATLRAWFDADGSTALAGRRLHCHANTVRYRLGKLAEATGRQLTRPTDVAHLYLAMEARRLLGKPVVAGDNPSAN